MSPERTACVDETHSLSYQELCHISRAVGAALSQRIRPRQPVAIYMEKGCAALSAFFGVVYAGGFYSYFNPELPAARLQQIQSVLGASCVITDQAHRSVMEEIFPASSILLVEELMISQEDQSQLAAIRAAMIDTDPLYVNFTSGSTGLPKGVLVSHRSVLDFIDVFTDAFSFTQTDRIGNQAPFDFDVSVKDIYPCLKMGATLEVIPKKYFSVPKKLLDFLDDRKVTSLTWAVSALCIISMLKGFRYKVPTTLRRVMFSGEVMPVKQLNYWRKYLPDVLYVNLYGPTEITCNCNYYIVDREFTEDQTLPIGVPFPNERVFLLDEEDHLVTEPGVLGEICVSGTALALGYYRNWEKTSEAFVQNPLNHRYLEPIYRTGDLGRYENGELYYVTRKDFQIKHMGHRIELGEIETAFQALDGISRVCCIYDEPNTKIIGFYVGELEAKEIIERLTERLPRFMIPNVFRQVDEMPLTKNGKIDRKCLMEEYRESMQNRVKS